MRVLFATSKGPNDLEAARTVFAQLRASAAEGNLTIPPGILWCEGPGCSNLAFDILGDEAEAERFAQAIAMVLMPCKYTTTTDDLPEVDTVALDKFDSIFPEVREV